MKKGLFLLLLVPQIALGAISYDTTASSGAAAENTGASWSHTTATCDNRLLVVYGFSRNVTPTGITYNGSALTRITSSGYYLNTDIAHLYILVEPTVGTNTVQVTQSNAYNSWRSVTYCGVDQDDPIVSYSAHPGDASSNNFTLDATSTVAESWAVAGTNPLDGSCTPGAGTAIRGTGHEISDSNGVFTTNHTLNYTSCGSRVAGKIWASIAPAEEALVLGTSTSEVSYEDWLLINSIIIGCLGFMAYGFIFRGPET